MKHVLITGGCGFVGRHFTRHFVAAGERVTIVDDLSAGIAVKDWKPPLRTTLHAVLPRVIYQDVREFFRDGPIDDWNFDLIIHCAAVVGGRLKIDGDPLAVATDLSIDSEFFNWCVRGRKKPQVVYFSSSAVYPVEHQTREQCCELFEGLQHFNGSKVGMPDQTYGWSKLNGEYLAKFAHEQYGLDVKIYRPFGGYGEDQSFDYPFPSIIRRVVDGDNPVVVWGSGHQQRDFIHISDVVNAVLTTLPVLPACEPLNLGTGRALSFMELALLAGQELGIKVVAINDPDKPEGVFSRVAGVQKLSKYWQPTIPVEEGIRRMAAALTKTS